MFFVLGFLFYATYTPSYQKNDITNPVRVSTGNNSNQKVNLVVNEQYISYIINEMGGYKLKSYMGNPKIQVEVDKDKFNSEVTRGKIVTKRGEASEPDLIIRTSKDEVLSCIVAKNPSQYIKNSVANGNTQIELVASYTVLFARGYLNLYKDVTGKTLTGSVIKVFDS